MMTLLIFLILLIFVVITSIIFIIASLRTMYFFHALLFHSLLYFLLPTICKPKYVVSTYLSVIFTCQVVFFTYLSGTSLVRSPSSLEIFNLSLNQVNYQIWSLGPTDTSLAKSHPTFMSLGPTDTSLAKSHLTYIDSNLTLFLSFTKFKGWT